MKIRKQIKDKLNKMFMERLEKATMDYWLYGDLIVTKILPPKRRYMICA